MLVDTVQWVVEVVKEVKNGRRKKIIQTSVLKCGGWGAWANLVKSEHKPHFS